MSYYEKPYYDTETKQIVEKIKNTGGDFLFSVITDTHLDNSLDDSIENIRRTDEAVNFRCLMHLGDFLNGNIPYKYTKEVIKNEMKRFRKAVKSGEFYPVQGNHDGYMDRVNYNANDIALDEDWYEATKFVEENKNVSRIPPKPYFYVDFPEDKIRFIILNSCPYEIKDGKIYKQYGFSDELVRWVKKEALNIDSRWTVMFFSHISPVDRFENVDSSLFIKFNGELLVDTILLEKCRKNFNIAAWFIGDLHGDAHGIVKGINMIVFACETAYVPQLWSMPSPGGYYDRHLNTATEDLWNAVALDKKERKIKIIRYGAGEDFEMGY